MVRDLNSFSDHFGNRDMTACPYLRVRDIQASLSREAAGGSSWGPEGDKKTGNATPSLPYKKGNCSELSTFWR
jgi:hypothetical protein